LSILLLLLSIILIAVSKIIHRNVRNLKTKYKIPEGRIAYSDLNKPSKTFFSKRYRITGKPDYIVKKNKRYIPVEVKTGSHNEPQKNHIFQLAGYCHLLEENYGSFVPYGILIYNDRYQYKIPFDPRIRFEFESTVKNMRNIMKTSSVTRNHSNSYKCKSCSMRRYCDVKLL
jgi:CRISPR-associated exonuclease Cas4